MDAMTTPVTIALVVVGFFANHMWHDWHDRRR